MHPGFCSPGLWCGTPLSRASLRRHVVMLSRHDDRKRKLSRLQQTHRAVPAATLNFRRDGDGYLVSFPGLQAAAVAFWSSRCRAGDKSSWIRPWGRTPRRRTRNFAASPEATHSWAPPSMTLHICTICTMHVVTMQVSTHVGGIKPRLDRERPRNVRRQTDFTDGRWSQREW